MEALLFMFDVGCMTYLCWRIYKLDPKRPTPNDFGFFRYQSSDSQLASDTPNGKSKGMARDRARERSGA